MLSRGGVVREDGSNAALRADGLRYYTSLRIGLLIAGMLVFATVVVGAAASAALAGLERSRARSSGMILARAVSGALAASAASDSLVGLEGLVERVGQGRDVLAVSVYGTSGDVLAAFVAPGVGGEGSSRSDVVLRRALASDGPIVTACVIGSTPAIQSWTPVVEGGRRLGTVAVAYDRQAPRAALRQVWIAVLLLVIGCSGLGVALSSLLGELVAGPVRRLATASKALAAGDLAVSLGTERAAPGEVAALREHLAELVQQLRSVIQEAQDVGAEVEDASVRLLERAKAGSSQAVAQASSLSEVSATMQELSATIKSISAQATQVAELVTTVQMGVEKGLGAVRGARERMDEVRLGSESSATQAAELAAASHRIREVVLIIEEIARRTKILAVNAAIEAARAGEFGAGFTVVAAEVRQLADSVAESTRRIEDDIAQFSEATSAIVRNTREQARRVQDGAARMEEVDQFMHEIEELAGRAANTAQEISFGAQQEEAGAALLLGSVHEIAGVARELAEGSAENKDVAGRLAALTERVVALVRRFRLG